ncbi:MAG: DUF6785 family protein [Armatimonadota bacterium]
MKLSFRALVIGLIGIVLVSLVVSWAELVTGQIMIGLLQIPPVVIAALFVIVILTRTARRVAPRLALTPPETAVVYCMLLVAAMLSSHGLMQRLLPTMVGANYYADPGNRWEQLFYPYIKSWMVPWDPGAGPHQFVVNAFYEGLKEGERLPWRAWMLPLGAWMILALSIFAAFFFLATLLRRQWSDNERLSYPLVQLPVEMIREQPGRSFLSNPLTWIGFAIPTIVYGINGLHNWNPSLPALNLSIYINDYLHDRPWSDISWFMAYISPGAVGFFYLLPLELLLSFWVFLLLAKAQDVVVSALALPPLNAQHAGANGYMAYQTTGAYFMLVLYLGAVAWPHLKGLLRQAVGRAGPQGRDEMVPYRAAVWGLVLTLAVAVLWLLQSGMTIAYAILVISVYVFVEAVVMARGCAEGGLPMAEGCFTPMDVSALLVPQIALGPRNLTSAAFFDAIFTRDMRGVLLTAFLDGQKLGDDTGVRRRTLAWVFGIAVVVTIPVAAFIQLNLPYHRAALTLYDYMYRGNNIQFFQENAAWLQGENPHLSGALISFVMGAGVTAMLAVMRVRYVGWPFHPLGYVLSTSWTVLTFWFPMLIAWIIKSIVVRYGGMRLYARLRPLFLGLIFGEFTSAVMWTFIAVFWHVKAPFFPWT